MKRFLFTLALVAACSSRKPNASVQQPPAAAAAAPAAPAARADSLKWQASWPRTEEAYVTGDQVHGPWVFRFRMPSGYWIYPHTHPVDAHIRVISGTFLVGMGTELDSTKVRALAPGEAIDIKTGMAHFEGTRGPTDIEVSGVGPWGITFVDPSRAP